MNKIGKWLALLCAGWLVLSAVGCSSSGGRVYYQAHYGSNPWGRHYYRPGYIERPIPEIPDRPVAVPLPEPPMGGMPDIGMPDFGGGLDIMPLDF